LPQVPLLRMMCMVQAPPPRSHKHGWLAADRPGHMGSTNGQGGGGWWI